MFVLAVFFCLFLVIYNVVYISLGSDIKQYGLLRTIGATNRQIKISMYANRGYLFEKLLMWCNNQHSSTILCFKQCG